MFYLLQFFFIQYCNEIHEHLNSFEAEVGGHLDKEKERLKEVCYKF